MRRVAAIVAGAFRRYPWLGRVVSWDGMMRRWPELNRQIRLLDRAPDRMRAAQPDWTGVLDGDAGWWPRRAGAAGEVLIATSVGAHAPANRLESLVGAALTLRGARIGVLLCDAALPACVQCSANLFPRAEQLLADGPARDICAGCHQPARELYESLGFDIHRYGDFLARADYDTVRELVRRTPDDALAALTYMGAAVGEHALAGTLRFFARATLTGQPHAEAVLRRYLEAAMLTALVMRRLLTQRTFRCVIADHGIYVPQGVVGEVCRSMGVRVVHWQPAYRAGCFVFSHRDTYHRTMMDEPTDAWENMEWTPAVDAELTDYLRSRWYGTNDWIKFVDQPDTDLSRIRATFGIDPSRPCVGLLTNVIWDAQVSYPSNAFPHMMAWLQQTIDAFRHRPELQLLIRVHPAERYAVMPSCQRVMDEIAATFPTLPPNVFVIGPRDRASTYALMGACDTVLIYATKTGVELTSMGIPVIVAGEAWIRGKGITTDIRSAEHYARVLDSLPLGARLDADTVRQARRYAYHFFFRRMIPLGVVKPSDDQPPYALNVATLGDLLPGADSGLDVICDGILNERPFIYPAELRHAPEPRRPAAAAPSRAPAIAAMPSSGRAAPP